jgi:hypothetical protein
MISVILRKGFTKENPWLLNVKPIERGRKKKN